MPKGKINVENLTTNFDGFDKMALNGDVLTFSLPGFSAYDGLDMSAVRNAVNTRIAEAKPGAGVLSKQLERLAHHVEQLGDSAVKLFSAYQNITAKPTRTSAAAKARRAMLEAMSNKMLKEFAGIYMDISEYVLPDDRAALIDTLLAAMAHSETESETSEKTEQVSVE